MASESSGQYSLLQGSPGASQLADTQQFLQLLSALSGSARNAAQAAAQLTLDEPSAAVEAGLKRSLSNAEDLFEWEAPVWIARAPGRLDVMGGIADYSGSLVLQLPLAQACHVACQVLDETAGQPPAIRILSLPQEADTWEHRGTRFELQLADLFPKGQPLAYTAARQLFSRAGKDGSWAAYVAGALLVLAHEQGASFTHGLSILVSSAVPEGAGVSSSAALEVTAMQAVAAAHSLSLDGPQLALLCQKVENEVVGAPCGVMDQMAASVGEAGCLMALTCQPAQLHPNVAIPPYMAFWGIDSGQRHSVGGADYGTVRAAAFMGLQLLALRRSSDAAEARRSSGGGEANGHAQAADAEVPDPADAGYLAGVSPSEFAARFQDHLPGSISGSDFSSSLPRHWDTATSVQPQAQYPVLAATRHPIEEHFRVSTFRALLQSPRPDDPAAHMSLLGELMYQSHESYSACGLGSERTDALVTMVRQAAAEQKQPVLFGAKITGGGCGGTVCVLAEAGARGHRAVQKIAASFGRQQGLVGNPRIFDGSSAGAMAFGSLQVLLQRRH